jgi:hypothetical protein
MKTPTAILFFFLVTVTAIKAQNREVVVTRGFENLALTPTPLPGNQWVFSTLSSPASGAIYQDTITLWVTDSLGRPVTHMTVQPPITFERMIIENVWALLDTSIIILYGGGDCDACCYGWFMEKWNRDGSFAWRFPLPDYVEHPFAVSSVSPAQLYILNGYMVYTVNAATGQIIGEIQFTTNYPSEALFMHGTADIMVFDHDSIAYYQLDAFDSIGYHQITRKHFTNHLFDKQASPDGFVYAGWYLEAKLIRIDTDLNFKTVAYPYNTLWDFYPTNLGVISLLRNIDVFQLQFFDTLGQLKKIFPIKHPELQPYTIAGTDTHFAITGTYTPGESGNSTGPAAESWFRIYDVDSLSDHQMIYSVAITDIQQRTPIEHDSTFVDYPNFVGYLDNIYGGDFAMQVKNTGNQPIQSFRLNAKFQNDWYYWWCGLDMVKNKQYYISLEPGESAWVDFGNIEAINQSSIPDQFRFWTSAPDDRPDDLPEDDTRYINWFVPLDDPTNNSISLYPNPATDEISITGISTIRGITESSIIGIDGKNWLLENIVVQDKNYTINTSHLPAGMYILKIAELTAPLIIHRSQ